MLRFALGLAMATSGAATNAEGESFLVEKAREKGVVVLPSGLMCAHMLASIIMPPPTVDAYFIRASGADDLSGF